MRIAEKRALCQDESQALVLFYYNPRCGDIEEERQGGPPAWRSRPAAAPPKAQQMRGPRGIRPRAARGAYPGLQFRPPGARLGAPGRNCRLLSAMERVAPPRPPSLGPCVSPAAGVARRPRSRALPGFAPAQGGAGSPCAAPLSAGSARLLRSPSPAAPQPPVQGGGSSRGEGKDPRLH